MTQITNIAAYKFVSLTRLPKLRKTLRQICKQLGLLGTILLSDEGINLFMAGSDDAIRAFLDHLKQDERFNDLEVKLSYSDRVPFRRMLVKLKSEIITFDIPGIAPAQKTSAKLPPEELKRWLDEGRPVKLLDVRNDYEIKLGAFDEAVPIGVDNFRDFPAKTAELPDEWKQQPIVMYCTGGIRCEKAGPLMEQQGFENVYQLEGGILKYFEKCGGDHYQGECFVFDQRVALDPQLEETESAICFSCQATLTVAEQASPKYVVGKSCQYCYRSPQESMELAIERRHAVLRKLVQPLPGSVPYVNIRPINVPLRCDGATIWEVITQLHPHVSLDAWRAAITEGRLQSDGQPIAAETVVRAGQRIENVIPGTVEPDVSVDLKIIYEDDMILVINKPAPLPMHPSGRYNRNTLISILNQLYHPQVVRVAHRLDANTTGLVVFSRTRPIAGILQPQFQRGEVDKTYLAKIHGHPPADRFQCDAAINNEPLRVGRRVIADEGRASLTEFEVISRQNEGTSIVKVWPRTGRTNQIRLHLAHLGYPICGDPTYGVPEGTEPRQTLDVNDPPLCLHAWRIAFHHPLDGKKIEFEAACPESWGVVI